LLLLEVILEVLVVTDLSVNGLIYLAQRGVKHEVVSEANERDKADDGHSDGPGGD